MTEGKPLSDRAIRHALWRLVRQAREYRPRHDETDVKPAVDKRTGYYLHAWYDLRCRWHARISTGDNVPLTPHGEGREYRQALAELWLQCAEKLGVN